MLRQEAGRRQEGGRQEAGSRGHDAGGRRQKDVKLSKRLCSRWV